MPEDAFPALMGSLDYPMVIVTTQAGGRRDGCLVGFATQCSIHPPRYLVCISDKNRTHATALRSKRLAVHVLEHGQGALASLFGEETGDGIDKFERCEWEERDGVPVLAETGRAFTAEVLDVFEFGDHTGFVLQPLTVRNEARGPTLGFQSVKAIEPGHPP